MELQGDLSDFSLSDILQIIGVSHKTGTLLISSKDRRGIVVFIRGRVVQALTDSSPGSLGPLLVERGILTAEGLLQATAMQGPNEQPRLLGTSLVALGLVERRTLNGVITQQIQDALADLLTVGKGSFELKLNVVPMGRSRAYAGQDFVLLDGLGVEELLLSVAAGMDEARREAPLRTKGITSLLEWLPVPTDSLEGYESLVEDEVSEDPEVLIRRLDPFATIAPAAPPKPLSTEERFARLSALLVELAALTSEDELVLAVMRYASEFTNRGVLFSVRNLELCGNGQFGVAGDGIPADERVRGIKLRLDQQSTLADVVRKGERFGGKLKPAEGDALLVERLGEATEAVWSAAFPLVCDGVTKSVIYLDNYPTGERIEGEEELELLVRQAGVLIEKLRLRRRLGEIVDPEPDPPLWRRMPPLTAPLEG